ncbi:acetate kinase [Clostridia bacterium]|nr:acetate kinase [Clostridia bacterium]
MKVLVVNAGSSSLKYQIVEMDTETVLARGNCERIGIDGRLTHIAVIGGEDVKTAGEFSFPTHTEAFAKVVEVLTTGEHAVIASVDEIAAVGHRVVHGGEKYGATTEITDTVLQTIYDLRELAPVHNPPAWLAVTACRKVMPNCRHAAIFDTAFHATLPEKAFMFGLPYETYEKYSVRKYGFHGTSHRFVTQALADKLGKPIESLKIVSCHLGNGSSITAVDSGKSVDTTMGFTPLDGVIMGTRCGAVDPSAVLFLQEKLGLTAKQAADYLNKQSGLLGVGGFSDNRDLSAAAEKGDKRAILATELLRYGIKKYIGAYAAVMNGLDAVIFTGGIGENSAADRLAVCENMEYLGIKVDSSLNNFRGELRKLSTADSRVAVWVVPTNEELLIARDTKALFAL